MHYDALLLFSESALIAESYDVNDRENISLVPFIGTPQICVKNVSVLLEWHNLILLSILCISPFCQQDSTQPFALTFHNNSSHSTPESLVLSCTLFSSAKSAGLFFIFRSLFSVQ